MPHPAYFEITHIVGFEETNLVGNVYYANHIRWQGRCRELFLRQHAPDILGEMSGGLSLVTRRVSCEYLLQLYPFDEVVIRMRLGDLGQSSLTLRFEYFRRTPDGQLELAATGEQQVSSMRREGDVYLPTPIPRQLREALQPFGA